MDINLRDLRPGDWPEVRTIYEDGIRAGHATFETRAPSWEEWDRGHLKACRLVAEAQGRVQGWAALAPVSDRCVYGGVAELSVYVGAGARGKGVGRHLLQEVVVRSEEAGFWTLQAGIFPENQDSVRLHEACGFRTVGVRERLGELDGRWRDVLFMERRSASVGAG